METSNLSLTEEAMKIYIDSADKNEIVQLMKWGSFAGITTNPVILRNSKLKAFEAIEQLAPLFDGDFFVQTWGNDADTMTKNAEEIAIRLGDRAIIKIPSTPEGFQTIHNLSKKNIRTAATALFTPGQAILATEAGATMVIPFFNRLEEAGEDALKVTQLAIDAAHGNGRTQVLVASLKKPEQIHSLLPLSVDAITIPPSLIKELGSSPLTAKVMETFSEASTATEE
jgi:transaldolase